MNVIYYEEMKHTVSIILIQGDTYVLQHRDNKSWIADPDTYGAWGGSVEDTDESIEAAAMRELAEETNLVIADLQLIPIGKDVQEARAPENKGQQILFHYFAAIVPENIVIKAYEGQAAVAITLHETALQNLNPIARTAIVFYEKHLLR